MQTLLSFHREISTEFLGVLRRDVERCVERARRANRLGPAWSVTEALDFGQHVLIRFERSPNMQPFTVRVRKATLQATKKAG